MTLATVPVLVGPALVHAGALAKSTLAVLGTTALHGTVLALLVYGLSRALRLRPATQAALWLVVIAKLALPWAPALPWSLADLVALWRGGHAGTPLVLAAGPHTPASPPVALGPALAWLLLAAGWLAGATIVVLRAVRAELGIRRALRSAVPAPASALAILRALVAGSDEATDRLPRVPRLVVGASAVGPHVVGLVRATIVVPPALLAEPALLRAALAHELGHVRRHDAVARLGQLVAHALLWWCPTVHLASRRLDLAREQACDALALGAGDLSRPEYARLLVRMAHLGPVAAPAPALAAPRALDARVTAILDARVLALEPPAHHRATLRRLASRVAIVAAVPVALGGARPAAARDRADVCVYSPELATALMEAYPDADRDGDGTVTRAEACEFQAEYRRLAAVSPPAAPVSLSPDPASADLLAEPLCCNCDESLGRSATPISSTETRCYRDEGD